MLYALLPIIFIGLFSSGKNLTLSNTIWQIANLAVVALVGMIFFNDKLTRMQWIGFALAIVAAVLLVM